MSLHYRRRLKVGPLRLNVTARGLTSVALVLGPLTWNLTRRRTSVDLPGGLSWRQGGGA